MTDNKRVADSAKEVETCIEKQSKIFERARTDKQLHGLAFRNPTLRLAYLINRGTTNSFPREIKNDMRRISVQPMSRQP
ncbi:MAG: hypothetical protein QNL43_00655 [Crocinitomicaceae bacterium]